MQSVRTIPIILDHSQELVETLGVIRTIKNDISSVCYNNGNPLSSVLLHNAVYHKHKGRINSQLLCSIIRLVAVLRRKNISSKRRLSLKNTQAYS